MGAGKGKEEEEECACKLPTHCYEMITDGIARFANDWNAGSFSSQGCFRLGGEDEASGHLRLFHGLRHIERSGQGRDTMTATTLYKGKMKKQ